MEEYILLSKNLQTISKQQSRAVTEFCRVAEFYKNEFKRTGKFPASSMIACGCKRCNRASL